MLLVIIMHKNIQRKGFTLIELLVVIAIIGLLASVVMSSLNAARDKGMQAKITAQMANVRSAAENHAATYNNYGTSDNDCAVGMFIDTVSGITEFVNPGNYPSGTTITCEANDVSYAVKASWTDGEGVVKYWCVDNTGEPKYAETTEMLIDTDVHCDEDDV